MAMRGRLPHTVPFVRAVLELVRAGAGDGIDTRLDDAAMLLVTLMNRHGVDVVARNNGYPALDGGGAFERVAPFLAETWLVLPAEWTPSFDVVVDRMSAWPSRRHWA